MLPRGWVRSRAWWSRWASHTPPVWIPTREVSFVTKGRMDSAKAWNRTSASSLGMAVGVEKGLQNDLGGHRVEVGLAVLPAASTGFPQPLIGFRRTQALVHPGHRESVAPVELLGEAFAAGGEGMFFAVEAPMRKATSSTQAILSPWRDSMAST